jgi:hypothetical protein
MTRASFSRHTADNFDRQSILGFKERLLLTQCYDRGDNFFWSVAVDLDRAGGLLGDDARCRPRIIKNQCPIRLVEEPRELAKGALAARPNSFLVDGVAALRDPQSDTFDIHFRGLQSHVKKPCLKPDRSTLAWSFVPGLVPGIHAARQAWMAGTSPATNEWMNCVWV